MCNYTYFYFGKMWVSVIGLASRGIAISLDSFKQFFKTILFSLYMY